MHWNCSKVTLQRKTIIYFGLIVFLFESLQQQQKTWEQITPCSLNQHVFEDQWQFFDFDKDDFYFIRQILVFCKPFLL